ncbi:MAG: LuxR family transcriptional regulator [Ktedonobacteraceae bacterium]
MPDLPTGTVTMLFTDIEGSTYLLELLGERYTDVLADYRSLLRTAFHTCGGYEVDTQGDAFFVAFSRATEGVSAAVEIQRSLASHAWPDAATMATRIGLHTGEPQLSAEGYVGLDVHHAARIMSTGHGGQVLLSQTTRDLVAHTLPEGVGLRDLGEHRLKDLQRATHLYQLLITGLPTDFPALKTLDTYHHNLPVQLTLLIGREKEVATIQRLLQRQEVRLLTLTGPGGTGKTRLGLQVAAELGDLFSDGVYFVNLAPISDPALVVPTIAQALDLKETGDQPLLDILKMSLRDKQLLLLLDNFEQVISAAPQVTDLLAACPNLKVMVTSRAVLHVQGEQEFAVPPLAMPDPKHLPDLVALSQYEAVALFLARAQAVKPEFQVTNASAPAIAEICVRLDGLPLAIELAAARIKVLPPQALLARLGQRLALLTGGARDAPARQQTLRNTIKWSYDLLNADEQRLFRRLSVFVGGCTLEAGEALCIALDGGAEQVLEGVASLLDKSLLQQTEHEGGEPRFTLLETVREYGLECLHESGEAEVSQRAHALHYLAYAEEAEPHLKGAQQVWWWRRLEQEQENLRAALVWLIGQEEGELALRLSGALWWFWNIRGSWSEGWRWLEAVLQLPQAQGRTTRRAKALSGAGMVTSLIGHSASRALLEESVAISRELGDKRGLTEALGWLGLDMYHSTQTGTEVAASRALLEESLVLAREVDDPWLLANALRNVGEFMVDHGDYKGACLLLGESVTLYRALKDQQALSRALRELVNATLSEGQVTQAAVLAQENLELARGLDNGPDLTRALYWLAVIRSSQGEAEEAAILLEESLTLARVQGDRSIMANLLLTLGGLAIYQGDLLRAERCAQESLVLSRELRSKDRTAIALSLLGDLRRRKGDLTQARAIYTEGALLAAEGDGLQSIGWNLIGLAKVVADEGQPEHAARLFGAAVPWLNPSTVMDPAERADYESAVEGVRAQLDEKAFAAAWAEGRSMTPEQALAAPEPSLTTTPLPAQLQPAPFVRSSTASKYPDGLTAREVEVLRLVAKGLTDAQVAEQLVISPRTVNWHLTSIYSKLQVSSRSAATRYAIEQHLV